MILLMGLSQLTVINPRIPILYSLYHITFFRGGFQDKKEPQIQRGQRIRMPKRKWPEEKFETKRRRKMDGKKDIVAHVDIEPITRSYRKHDIT